MAAAGSIFRLLFVVPGRCTQRLFAKIVVPGLVPGTTKGTTTARAGSRVLEHPLDHAHIA
jgi:hypothetical protein